MVRGFSLALSFGLVVLWLVGLERGGVPWMAWIDLALGVAAFLLAVIVSPRSRASVRVGGPLTLSAGLFVLWLAGVSTASPALWLAWWNFAFACAFLLLGLAASPGETASYGDIAADRRGTYGTRGLPGLWGPLEGGYPYGWGYGWGPYGASPLHFGKGPKGYQRTDEKIREEIHDRLTHNWHLDASEIEVAVAGGEVTLTGWVGTRRDRRLAEEIADSVLGVRDLHNKIEVRRPSLPETKAA